MRLLVCGSRSWTDEAKVDEVLERVTAGHSTVVLIHGDARGADRIAAEVARRRGWQVEAYPADWDRHGRQAGMIRNREMLATAKPDLVVAFLDERSRPSVGTRHMIDQARREGLHGLVVRAGS